MPSLDDLKQKIGTKAAENPETFFAVSVLREYGFNRNTCSNCHKKFWAQDNDRDVCGEPECGNGYTFINDPPTEKTFDFVSAWEAFASFMEDREYTPIDRYPVAARWRDDTAFVRASIYDFQPYVVSGEVEPPANPLVVPQFCIRFNDIDNVGLTGRHYTGFIMTGQHAFDEPDSYDQDKYFKDMLDWVHDGMDISLHKIILHEDTWGGGGNLGACMEFFVDGLELFNQVYMFFKVDPSDSRGYSELDTKVLDMGLGHERIVWITHGSETSYEANMPDVIDKLYEETGYEPDRSVWEQFLPHSSLLNNDEVDDVEAVWDRIADRIGIETEQLKEEVQPAAALYAIADHTRTLLVALSDGILPSNTGEQHSLRVVTRRAMDLIDRYDWELDITEIVQWHAESMGDLYPELKDNLDHVLELIEHEKHKYYNAIATARQHIETLDEDDIDNEKLVELYDSYGVSPDLLEHMGYSFDVPSDFYARVSARHDDETDDDEAETGQTFDLSGIDETDTLYYEDEQMDEFKATIEAIIKNDGNTWVVLDRTAFYPTGGGQMHDTGVIDDVYVIDVVKEGGVILHKVEDSKDLSEGSVVQGAIDWDRRWQLMQHHTATHLINGATKDVIDGGHVSQAGAKKTVDKARLDITHYEKLSDEQVESIQQRANQWIQDNLSVEKEWLSKDKAEQQYGFSIYQGGVPPGNSLRIVTIGDEKDIEACGGTHVDRTSSVEDIVITRTTKVQDGVIRIEFKAGNAAELYKQSRQELKDELETWISLDDYSLEEIAGIFDVEVAELSGVVQRFVDEWGEQRDEIWNLQGMLDDSFDTVYDDRPRDPEELFSQWKEQKKEIEELKDELERQIIERVLETDKKLITHRINLDDVGALIGIVNDVTARQDDKAIVLRGKNAIVGARGSESSADIHGIVSDNAEIVQGDESFVKGFKLTDQ